MAPGATAAVRELERVEWRRTDAQDPATLLQDLLQAHGLGGELASSTGEGEVVLLAGADACARLAGLPEGRPTPADVPDLIAIAVAPADEAPPPAPGSAGEWSTTWSDVEHASAVEQVRAAIARGDVYQANVVGHRRAPLVGDPRGAAAAVAAIPAAYAGALSGQGWAVGCASPEQLMRVDGARVTTVPVKGTRVQATGAREDLLASLKDRAEHVMIVDLERNDLAQVARTGTVTVDQLYDVSGWAGLWHAASTVAADLAPGVGVLDLLRALAPGGSVTGAPKRAALGLLAGIEPVGRGPAMGLFGTVRAGGCDLGLTIRTVAVDDCEVHLWAGGGITWGSDPVAEVAEAHAKAAPVQRALARSGPRSPAPW